MDASIPLAAAIILGPALVIAGYLAGRWHMNRAVTRFRRAMAAGRQRYGLEHPETIEQRARRQL